MRAVVTICGICGISVAALAAGFDRARFAVPENIHSPGFFWMWNTRLDSAVLNAQLGDMVSNGVRSVCIHPFPKGFRKNCKSEMEPDYLTPDYFRVYGEVVDHAASLGMNVWLYDEGGWPSGRACGLVERSDREGRFRPRFAGYGADGAFGVGTEGGGPSLLEPGAAERFVELTHERYRNAVGRHFGRTIRFAFTDEPSMHRGVDEKLRRLGWSSEMAERFRREKGRDPMTVARHIVDTGGTDDERIDYNEVRARAFEERYFGTISAWCRRNGLLSSGHLNSEDVPNRSSVNGCYGSLMGCLRTLDVPGVDVIWRQLFPACGGRKGAALPFPRYASSVAHQRGSRLVLSESCCIYGNSMTPDEMKWLVDYQMVRGVNLFVFGYYNVSNAGQWMALFEPHSGPKVPFWSFERPYFDYIARTSQMLADGRPAADVVVLFDQRGLWSRGQTNDEAWQAHLRVARILDERHCDWDFADDEILETAHAEGRALAVGKMRYGTLVLPTWRSLSERSKAVVAAFERAGGRVLRGLTEAEHAPVACEISGEGSCGLRVTKRTMGGESLYFLVNETASPAKVRISFRERGSVVCANALTADFEAVSAKNGMVDWEFPPCGSAMFIVGATANRPASNRPRGKRCELSDGWTLERISSHFPGRNDLEVVLEQTPSPTPVTLGDWRGVLGETFSGVARYRMNFDAPHAGRARLDLGRVCWTCRVRLNGRPLRGRFFGPFAWDVEVKAGANVLEVEVANTFANAFPDEVRDRVFRDYPPVSSYDARQRAFDRDNHESGLFGPVTLTCR